MIKAFTSERRNMKRIIEFIKSNYRQIVQLVLLLIVIVIPLFVDWAKVFEEYIDKEYITPQNFVWRFCILAGRPGLSLLLSFLLIKIFRKANKDYTMNQGNVYHNYCFIWYWICAKILGIMKCSLIRVPIFMQFKLVIRDVFESYPLDETLFPVVGNEPDCQITIYNNTADTKEINIMLEDTYRFQLKQLPSTKQKLYTIRISRNDGSDTNQHFSEKLVSATINEVKKRKRVDRINVYATTNPMNTKHIAERAFKTGGRGDFAHLYVFQQESIGDRNFIDKGIRII